MGRMVNLVLIKAALLSENGPITRLIKKHLLPIEEQMVKCVFAVSDMRKGWQFLMPMDESSTANTVMPTTESVGEGIDGIEKRDLRDAKYIIHYDRNNRVALGTHYNEEGRLWGAPFPRG